MSGSERRKAFRQFTTGVAFITTHGSKGPNVMAAEWTYNVSYDPFLISVHLGPGKATFDAVQETGEFGVNIVSEEQATAMAFAGHFTGRSVNKLSSELFDTYRGNTLGLPMIHGCLLNAECRLVNRVQMGDHTAFVGEVVDFSVDATKRPIVLFRGTRRAGPRVQRAVSVAVAGAYEGGVAGSRMTIEGELAARKRVQKLVHVSIKDPEGEEVSRGDVRTDGRGRFHLEMSIPGDSVSGVYEIRAQYRRVVGKAWVEVT
ncbi:MAG: hypothetical protein GTO63_31670 [Anaerolineae bacterium]|nr:hypothetical protein [Anaerolineae bacterium]